MKRLLLLLLALFSFILKIHAQWMQIQDTSLLTNTVYGIARMGDSLYAATGSGIYYSSTESLYWKRLSDDYTPASAICAIDADLFKVSMNRYGNYIVMHSADKGHSWQSSTSPAVTQYVPYLYSYGHTLFLTDGNYNAAYSTDKGKTWAVANLTKGIFSPYYIGPHYVLDRNSDSFLIALDGVHFKSFFREKEYFMSLGSQILYDSGRVLLVHDGVVEQYDTLNTDMIRVGNSPGLENTILRDSSYFITDFVRWGNKFYARYREDTSSINAFPSYEYFTYSSTDQCRHWRREKNLPSFNFTNALTLPGNNLLSSDGRYLLLVKDSAVHTVEPGIETDKGLGLIPDSAILYQSAGDEEVKILRDRSLAFEGSFYNDLNRFFARLPSDIYDTSIVHNRLLCLPGWESLISDDYGRSWKPLLVPRLSSKKISVIGYTSSDLLTANDDTLFYSADGGENWQIPIVTNGYIGFKNAKAAVNRGQWVVLAADSTKVNAYQLFVSHDRMSTISPYGPLLKVSDNSTVSADIFVSSNGTPVVISDAYGPNSTLYYIYTLDTVAMQWHRAAMQGLPGQNPNPRLERAGSVLFMFCPGYGLYISKDLGDTFIKDESFPSSLKIYNSIYNPGKLLCLGNTVYVETNAGIWYNTSILAADNKKASEDNAGSFIIYPNPARESFSVSISSDSAQAAELDLHDIHGRICRSYSYSITKGTSTLNVSTYGLSKGIYILQLQTSDGVYTRKVVVE